MGLGIWENVRNFILNRLSKLGICLSGWEFCLYVVKLLKILRNYIFDHNLNMTKVIGVEFDKNVTLKQCSTEQISRAK